jgi:hypothetical protein
MKKSELKKCLERDVKRAIASLGGYADADSIAYSVITDIGSMFRSLLIDEFGEQIMMLEDDQDSKSVAKLLMKLLDRVKAD